MMPLTPAITGSVYYEVVNDVAESDDSIILNFRGTNAALSFTIRPGTGDTSAQGTASAGAAPGEVLYEGIILSQFLGEPLQTLIDTFGEPDGDPFGYPPWSVIYKNGLIVEFDMQAAPNEIWTIENIPPSMAELNGVTLDKTRAELVGVFGEPSSEYFVENIGDTFTWGYNYEYDMGHYSFIVTCENEGDKPYGVSVHQTAATTNAGETASGVVDSLARVPVGERLPRYTDDMGYLTLEQAAELTAKLDEISERHQFDIVVAVIEELDDREAHLYAADFFIDNDFGFGENRDGAILLIAAWDRKFGFAATGYGENVFTISGQEYLDKLFVPYLSDDEYNKAFIAYAEACDDFLTQAKLGRPYDQGNIPTTDDESGSLSADDARTILQAWLDVNPFEIPDSFSPEVYTSYGWITEEYGESTMNGGVFYGFLVDGLGRFGPINIVVHKETSEMFYYYSYGDMTLKPLDDW